MTMTRPPMRNLAHPETSSTTPTLINAIPLNRGVSHGVEEAVDKERAMQELELEAEADRNRAAEYSGEEGKEKDDEPDVYDRFPKRKKRLILCVVSYAAFLGRKPLALCDLPAKSADMIIRPLISYRSGNLVMLPPLHPADRFGPIDDLGDHRIHGSHLRLHHRGRSLVLVLPLGVLWEESDLPLEHTYLCGE